MFNKDLKEALVTEMEHRREQDKTLQNQIYSLQNKIDVLEKYLGIEFSTIPTTSKYRRNNKPTGTL